MRRSPRNRSRAKDCASNELREPVAEIRVLHGGRMGMGFDRTASVGVGMQGGTDGSVFEADQLCEFPPPAGQYR